MEARNYIENHWIKNEIWTHLEHPKHQDRLRNCASYLEGERFIDIGCALGHSTDIMKRFRPGDWSGIEFTEGAIEKAIKLFPEITFYHANDFNLLPVCGKFDGVVCSEVIEHVEDDEALVKGLLDITKKILIITTPNTSINDPGHLRVYTEKRLAELFAGHNFEIIRDGIFFYVVVKK